VHPLGKVRECAASLKDGELVCLRSSFRPEPLLDAMARGGFSVCCVPNQPGGHVTYVSRGAAR